MRYYKAKLQDHADEMGYRIYITDSLRNIPQDKYIQKRYCDMLKRNTDTRSGDEIAIDVIRELGLNIE